LKEIALYIHIPFCKSKCFYCDFNSSANNLHMVDKYIENLKKEIKMYSKKLKDYEIKTIFIGGGTPSYINERYIYEIMESANEKKEDKNDEREKRIYSW